MKGGRYSRREGEYLERKKAGNKEPIGVNLSEMVTGVMEAGELAGRRVWLSMLQPGTQLFRRVTSVYLSLDQDGPTAGRADEGVLRG